MPQGDGSAPAGQVAINGRAVVREQIGGVERFAREMARRLPLLSPERYRVITPPARLAHRAGHLWEQVVLPRRASRYALIYSPANLGPLVSKNVLVLHDVAALRHPAAYSRAYVSYQRLMLPALARRARRIITVSEFSKRELVEVLELDAAAIVVIPEGVEERFTPEARQSAPAIRLRYGLERPYVLTVGTVSARKNLEFLAAAAHALAARGAELVHAGSDRGYLRAGSVPFRRLGYVADEHLPALYAEALALAMPSRYEGFGLPCLEAMACGTPVVATRCGALPETIGDAGLLVEPGDADGFAEAILGAAFEAPLRQRMIESGGERSRRFSWDRTARLTDAVIVELLGAQVAHRGEAQSRRPGPQPP